MSGDRFCLECDWVGDDVVLQNDCPICWGHTLSVEGIAERAAMMEFSEADGVVSRVQAEYWAVASQAKGKLVEPVTRNSVIAVLERWRELQEQAYAV